MTAVFLDTGFLIALESSDDQYHREAATCWKEFEHDPLPLVTTSYVLDEVSTFFNSRGHHAKAVEIGEYLMQSASVRFVHVDEALFHDGWQFFVQHRDKRYSLTDCIFFALMRQMRLKTALAFDRHFTQAGFERRP